MRQSSPPFGSLRTGGASLWSVCVRPLIAVRSRRVIIFLDFQNVYHRARETFFGRDAPARDGQIDPLALGCLLTGRVPGGRLAGVRVYRGRPSQRRDRRSYSAHLRQTDTQVARGQGLVTVVARDLRYPAGWPAQPAQEKGIDVALAVDFVMMAARREFDVGVLFSSDTDLVPALEAVVALRPGQAPACEVAAWAAPGMRPRLLSVGSVDLVRHLLTAADFRAVADETDYARSS